MCWLDTFNYFSSFSNVDRSIWKESACQEFLVNFRRLHVRHTFLPLLHLQLHLQVGKEHLKNTYFGFLYQVIDPLWLHTCDGLSAENLFNKNMETFRTHTRIIYKILEITRVATPRKICIRSELAKSINQ